MGIVLPTRPRLSGSDGFHPSASNGSVPTSTRDVCLSDGHYCLEPFALDTPRLGRLIPGWGHRRLGITAPE